MNDSAALIVDDNPELSENVCDILATLEEPRVHCLRAGSGKEARAIGKSRGAELDLAIVDLRLPDIHGLDLIAQIRGYCPFAQVVIITGDATVESAVAAVGEGAFAYVLKPFRGDELIKTAQRGIAQAALLREHDQLRRELEHSAQRYQELVEAVPAFVLALDASGKIVVWNRRLEQVTGFLRAEMLDQPGAELVGHGGDRKLTTKDGGHRLVHWQLAEVGAPGGTVKYALGTDVTDARDMQRRTLRAERLAAVGTLAAGLAHEVRNPLNSATLQLQLLKRRSERGPVPAAELLPILGIVGDEIRRLDRMVSDFLAFAQPRPLELVPADLNELVQTATELIRPEAQSRGVAVEMRLDPATGVVEAEPERLRQVLLNLTRNAIEAMSDGGTLTLGTARADAGGDVSILVEDTGPGFPEDAPVFDAFYTTKASGTGLGLAIVHRIVIEHGGSIQAESRPGCTRFIVKLPQMSSNGQRASR